MIANLNYSWMTIMDALEHGERVVEKTENETTVTIPKSRITMKITYEMKEISKVLIRTPQVDIDLTSLITSMDAFLIFYLQQEYKKK